jgi:stage II sporulation protein D
MMIGRMLIMCCFIPINLFAVNTSVKIGVLYGLSLTEINASHLLGNPTIYFDSLSYFKTDSLFDLKIISDRDSLSIKAGDSLIARCKTLRIYNQAKGETKVINKGFKNEKNYGGQLSFTNNNGFLFITNTIDLEDYLPGVLEAEVGLNRPPEYYKVQAIICRTYTLSHLRRHEMEDFNLCDKEHCQVYKGISKKSIELNKAVQKTVGIVMVDNDFMLITAAFHANCGGQTVNSEDVWNKKLDYLRSIKDTFCLHQKSAVWSKEISSEKWAEQMHKLCNDYQADEDSLLKNNDASFLQFSRKRSYRINEHCDIPLKDIRNSLGLRSTYFNAVHKNGQILLSGRGFGHGAGLCQDGAIRMSKLNYSYKSILHFYYQNVSIVPLDKLDFFKFNE